MHARVVTLQVKPDKAEEAVENYRASIANSKRKPGYKAGILLTDPETGKAFSITLWESEEDVRRGDTDGYYEKQMETMGDVWAKPPVRESYQVSLFYLNDPDYIQGHQSAI